MSTTPYLTRGQVQMTPRFVVDKITDIETKLGSSATITPGAETSNVIVAAIQLNDNSGKKVAVARQVTVWISDTAGAVPSGTAPNGATSITTGTVLSITTAKVLFNVISDATGLINLSIGESTAKSFYVNVSHGGAITSKIVTFV